MKKKQLKVVIWTEIEISDFYIFWENKELT